MTAKVAASSHRSVRLPFSPRNCGRNAAWKMSVLGLAKATAKPRTKARSPRSTGVAASSAGIEVLATELYGNARLSRDETIARLQAYENAGADVLFAPGLPDISSVRMVCAAVKKPFNFMVGIKGKSFSVSELSQAGVKRISLATSLYRAAMTGFLNAALEVKASGQFSFIDSLVTTPELNTLMRI